MNLIDRHFNSYRMKNSNDLLATHRKATHHMYFLDASEQKTKR